MTEKQKDLLYKLARIYRGLAEECMKDDKFQELMIENNDLIPMSLDELGEEWFSVAEEKKRN